MKFDQALNLILEGNSILEVILEAAKIIPFNDLRAELVTNFTTDIDKEDEVLKVTSDQKDWDHDGIISFTSSDLGILSSEVNDVIADAGYNTTVKLIDQERGKYTFKRAS